MTLTRLQRAALGVAGLTATGVGAAITLAPHAFYASYGIALGSSPDLLSELRAPGANLAGLGVVILAGLVRPAWAPVSALAALVVFLAFPLGRLVSLALDGMPSGPVLGALALELAIAALCLAAFRPARSRRVLAAKTL